MSRVFLEVFNLSVAACWIIAAVLVVRAIFAKRMPKWLNCCLWGLVAIRLVVPFTVESEFSLVPNQKVEIEMSAAQTDSEESIAGSIVSDESVPNGAVLENTVSSPEATPEYSQDIPAENRGEAAPDNIIADTEAPEAGNTAGENHIGGGKAPYTGVTISANGKSVEISENTLDALCIAWMSGIGFMLVYAIVSYSVLRRRVALTVPCEGGIRKGEHIDSPFVLGIFRPRIYIPFGLSAETESCVVAHERAHLKRGDHIVKPLAFFILSVYWFNPLVWVAYILLCRDIEYACDEKVINDLAPDARKAYALALLECAGGRKRISACPVAFGETGVKERVKNAMNYKKPTFWIIIICVVICAAVAVFFLTTGTSDGTDDSSASESGGAGIDESSDNTVSSGDQAQLDYIDGLFSAEMIDHDDIGKYENCYRYDSDDHSVSPILFVPKNVIYDVKVFSLSDEEWVINGREVIENILFEVEKVTSSKPLLADIKFNGAFAVNGISFTDEDGNKHFYAVSDSTIDESLIISKFENDGDSNEVFEDEDISIPDESVPGDEEDEPTYKIENIDGLFSAEMIDYDDIGKYGSCYRYDSDDHSVSPILFVPENDIYDVKIFTLSDEELVINGREVIEDILFEVEKVTSSKPLLADIKFIDLFAINGISFKDGDGNEHFYTVSDSARDGSLIISKFENEASGGTSGSEAHAHAYGTWQTVSAATCQSAGTKERVCSCGEKESQSIAKLSHTYTASTVAATCREQGYTLRRCSCGDEYKDNYTAKSYAHDFPRIGNTNGYDCTVCGLRVCAWGNFDSSILDVDRSVKYYITGSKNTTEERTLVIYGTGAIPDRGDYDTYWSNGGACFNDEIKHIVIAEGITSIGARAFYPPEESDSQAFGTVYSISIPSTVTHIGDYAFYGITFKRDFHMGKNVRTAGDKFMPQECNSLYIPKTLQTINHDFMGWIYYEGTEAEFANINFYDYYFGSCKYIDLYDKWGMRERISYNAW